MIYKQTVYSTLFVTKRCGLVMCNFFYLIRYNVNEFPFGASFGAWCWIPTIITWLFCFSCPRHYCSIPLYYILSRWPLSSGNIVGLEQKFSNVWMCWESKMAAIDRNSLKITSISAHMNDGNEIPMAIAMFSQPNTRLNYCGNWPACDHGKR